MLEVVTDVVFEMVEDETRNVLLVVVRVSRISYLFIYVSAF